MVLFPKKNKEYWIVTDLWETFCAITVTLIEENNGVFVGRWELGKQYFEYYEELKPNELYATELEAVEEIKKRRRIENARNCLLGG